jgi:ABC transport system ATP-binding/permease protein
VLTDIRSTNGTFVNGERISQRRIRETDRVQIGPYELMVSAGRVLPVTLPGAIRVEAVGLTTRVGKGRVILNDVSLAIAPGELVAIVGATGAGKTTLANALSGFRPATDGRVLYNGHDLYRTFDAFRTSIGYVPQDDIIHRDLTVHRSLEYATELRLPRDTSGVERRQRIAAVLADIKMADHRDTYVDELSGGQRKRMSMGVELLTKPSLFFLDEPTSGLDPATETHLMRLMRELTVQGQTLVLITHATQNILLCDKVAFISRGGNLAFFGTPREALAFFRVEEFVDIYEQLEGEPAEGHYARQYATAASLRHRPVSRATGAPEQAARQAHPPRPDTPGSPTSASTRS